MPRHRTAAVIVAAGRGERAGWSIEGPKQFRQIGGRPVLAWTTEAFVQTQDIDAVVVVYHPDDLQRAEDCVAGFGVRVRLVPGSATRQSSVLKGLEALEGDAPDIVLIHDGVRPFVSQDLIRKMVQAVEPNLGAVPATAVTDTIKRVGSAGLINGTVERHGLYAVQTPQAFPFDLILNAHRKAAKADAASQFTDDASILEWFGGGVTIVSGPIENLKLTSAADIVAADRKLGGNTHMFDVRTGNGYDVHQLVDGDHVTLCGVRIPHDQSLLGHSDADVGLHALTDALLATCGAGDIGTHFPPSDPQWKGAASSRFVRHAVEIVHGKGGRICNVDITLIAEAPKIGPHRAAMVAALAEMTGLDEERISVKATTNETIGFIGRREGIASIATASVFYGKQAREDDR